MPKTYFRFSENAVRRVGSGQVGGDPPKNLISGIWC